GGGAARRRRRRSTTPATATSSTTRPRRRAAPSASDPGPAPGRGATAARRRAGLARRPGPSPACAPRGARYGERPVRADSGEEAVMAKATVRDAVGVFHDEKALQAAVDELLIAGFDRSKLSLLADQDAVERKLGHLY